MLSVVALAAVMGGFLLTAQGADADIAAEEDALSNTAIAVDSNYGDFIGGGFGGHGFRGGHRGGPMGAFGGFEAVEVSDEFKQKVTSIAENDSDVQELLAAGYNVTGVRAIVKSVVDADGYVTAKATNAIVLLQKDTSGVSGCASVYVDVEAAKVTQVVILTRTVIDKS